jgi:hypothetical protein
MNTLPIYSLEYDLQELLGKRLIVEILPNHVMPLSLFCRREQDENSDLVG